MVAEFGFSKITADIAQRTGKEVSRIAVIMDLQGLGIRQLYPPALTYFTHLIQLAEANYPYD